MRDLIRAVDGPLAGIAAAAALLLSSGCAGPSRASSLGLEADIRVRQYPAAIAQIDAAKDSEYGSNSTVLYLLDKAAVLEDAGQYAEADPLLDQAEQKLDALYTESLHKGVATFLVNDLADDYRGEPYERALLHVYRALGYAYRDRTDDAVAEARRVDAFLTRLSDETGGKVGYRDDPFAQYLSALLYEDGGHPDDARIARTQAAQAVPVGPVVLPPDPGGSPPEFGELVLVHFNGIAPRRESHSIQVAWNDALVAVQSNDDASDQTKVQQALTAGIFSDAITVAFPEMVQDPYRIQASVVLADGQRVPTTVVEDIAALSRAALQEHLAAIRMKSIARATTKFLLAKLIEHETSNQLGSGWGMIAGIVGRAAAAASEVADTRTWRTLPAEIRLARLRLPPGVHDVEVDYDDARGALLYRERLQVEIQPARRTYVPVRTAL